MIDQHFQSLGFHPSETRVYLCLATLGKATAQLVAHKLDMPRTTVYSLLDSLIAKGFVSKDVQGERGYFVANGPNALKRFIENERSALKAREGSAQELMAMIEPYFKGENYSVPKLQFFEGKKNVEHMLYEYLPAWNKSALEHDNTMWGYQDPTVLEHYTDWLYHHWETKDPNQKIRLLSQKHEVEQRLDEKPSLREIRPLPQGVTFSSSIWVCGDYIVMIMTRQQPHYAFQILDKVFAANHRALFQLLWQLTNPTKRAK